MQEDILKKITDYKYLLPKSYKQGMKVEGIIYADKRLLSHIFKDKALEQVANVAHLPGIVKYSLAMPDIHWGYGFPIGGVAATDATEDGVISPGGVGYDINCLSKDTTICLENGSCISIKDLEKNWHRYKVKIIDLETKEIKTSKIIRFIKRRPYNKIFKIKTYTGEEIIATEDHPFFTPSGMKEVKHLKINDKVAIFSLNKINRFNP